MVAQLDKPFMRLVVDDVDDAPQFQTATKKVRRVAHATRLDHAVKARQNPSLNLVIRQLSELSATGTADQPLDPHERVSVTIPARGFNAPWSAVGRVIQCEPAGHGYRVNIEFDMTPSAA